MTREKKIFILKATVLGVGSVAMGCFIGKLIGDKMAEDYAKAYTIGAINHEVYKKFPMDLPDELRGVHANIEEMVK